MRNTFLIVPALIVASVCGYSVPATAGSNDNYLTSYLKAEAAAVASHAGWNWKIKSASVDNKGNVSVTYVREPASRLDFRLPGRGPATVRVTGNIRGSKFGVSVKGELEWRTIRHFEEGTGEVVRKLSRVAGNRMPKQ